MRMERGFTLIEMLVVLGIIAILVAASIGGYSKMTRSAERAKEQELVHDVATALTVLFQQEGIWPKRLAENGATDGKLDARTAYALVAGSRSYLSLTKDGNAKTLSGLDRFGIVTTWALATIKRLGNRADLSSPVAGTSRTVDDHILHYALDLDGDGIIENASVGGAAVNVRATAIVWSCGRDGVISPYPYGGGGSGGNGPTDDVWSWTPGMTRNVK